MAQGLSIFCIVLFIIIMAAGVDAQSLSESQAHGDPTAIASSGNDNVKILGIDSTAFPKIKVNLFIDKFCALSGSLKQENFKVEENGKGAAIDNLYFAGNASGHKLDLAIVFDNTGSMEQEISAMKFKVEDLTNAINVSGINARYCLVSFKDSVSIKTKWTEDSKIFKKNVETLYQDAGGDEPEVSLDAIEAVISMGFRPDAQKVILVITDAHAHYKNDGTKFSNYTKEEIEKDLRASGVIFIPISPKKFEKPSNGVDLRDVANDIQSMWIDINSADFSTILDQFKGILTGTYVIEYTSPDQTPGKNRTVLVAVNAPGCIEGSDSSAYTSPGSAASPNSPPIIDDLTSDKASPQNVGTDINWNAQANDPDGDQILYRFFLNDEPLTDWQIQDTLTWKASRDGSYRIEAQVRDGKHAGPNGLDDRKSVDFNIIALNSPPVINQLSSVFAGWAQNNITGEGGAFEWEVSDAVMGTEITWKANASDSDGDQILYKFFLNDEPMTDWTVESSWNWKTDAAGSYRADVHVRDGKHAGPNGLDDRRSASFNVTAPNLPSEPAVITDGSANSITQTNDGGYIIAGDSWPRGANFSARESSHEAWLIKTDSLGNEKWNKTFDKSLITRTKSVLQAKDGGYTLAGNSRSAVNSRSAISLIKIDSIGNMEWARTFGGPEYTDVYSIQQTNDEGYIIVARNDTESNYIQGWIIKTDSAGIIEWDYDLGYGYSPFSIKQTSDDGYIIIGARLNSKGVNTCDAFWIKADSKGKKEWEKKFSGESFYNFNKAVSVQQISDGGYLTIIENSTVDQDGYGISVPCESWMMKRDEKGNKEWIKKLDYDCYLVSSSEDISSDGRYILDSDLIKMDEEGNIIWVKSIYELAKKDSPNIDAVDQTSDGGCILAGSLEYNSRTETLGLFGSARLSNNDPLLIKIDTDGNALWDKVLETPPRTSSIRT